MEEIMATAKLESRPACGTNSIDRSILIISALQLKELKKLSFNSLLLYVPKMGSKLLMISVFVLDLIAFGLAVAAELKRNTAQIHMNTEYTYSYCVYDSDIATGFGVAAFLFLMATQILVMVASRCFCCGRALIPGPSRTCALLLFIISWVTFFIASGFLLVGSVRNSQVQTTNYDSPLKVALSKH
nr:uncharacterized protein LOC109150399 [Ipomoea batatas]